MFDSHYDSLAHCTGLDAGDPRKLSNKIEVLFKMTERHLSEVDGCFVDNKQCQALREEMKDYLRKINEVESLPLHFRIRVMDIFQQHYASFFDSEYVTLALKSYQIASRLMVQKLFETGNEFHLALMEITIASLTMSIRDLRTKFKKYQTIDRQNPRIVYELVDHVFQSLTLLANVNSERVQVFKTCLCWYEFLLRMDFFSKDGKEQDQVIAVLNKYIHRVDVSFFESGDVLPQQLDSDIHKLYLQVFPSYPDLLPQLVMKFESHETQVDTIVLDLTNFFDRICMMVNKHGVSQHERRGCEMIRKTLLSRMRKEVRRESPDTDVILDNSITKAFVNKLFSEIKHVHTEELPDTWAVTDYSRSGVSLKSTAHTKRLNKVTIGHLVGLRWIGSLKGMGYQLGFVRWYKHTGQEEMIGIEFFKIGYYMKPGWADETRTIVLQEKKDPHVIWLPHVHASIGDTLLLQSREGDQTVYIKDKLLVGDNYTRVRIVSEEDLIV